MHVAGRSPLGHLLLDWEGSRIGDRIEDLSWTTQRMWRFREDHLPIGGFGTIADLRSAYVDHGGEWDDDHRSTLGWKRRVSSSEVTLAWIALVGV